jgi:DNA-binding Lrp family transcriptional regulator
MVTLGLVWMKSKSQDVSLDDLDRQILRLLQEDAKQTYGEIGNKLNIAHSTVYDRIQKMEQAGFIVKYEAIVDTEKMGIPLITAHMTITTDPKELRILRGRWLSIVRCLRWQLRFLKNWSLLRRLLRRIRLSCILLWLGRLLLFQVFCGLERRL